MNLASNVVRSAQTHTDRAALRLGDGVVSFRELDRDSARVAGLLRDRGLRPGDRVGIMLPNIPEFAVVYFGVLRAGAVVVPMNPMFKAREVAYKLDDSGASLMFAWHAFAHEAQTGAKQAEADAIVVDPNGFSEVLASARPAEDVVDRDKDDAAAILYTSGTTGQPKGAELTQANLTRNTEVVVADLIRLTTDDVIFGGLPLFHAFGQTCTLENKIATPSAMTVLGVPVDLSRISVDSYLVAGIADHITPWQNCYRSTQLLGGDSRFILSTSGHIAALVNPPGNPKASYQVNKDNPGDPEQWLKTAETVQGSWWPDAVAWLGERCGAEKTAPEELGGAGLPALADAPGTYVLDN